MPQLSVIVFAVLVIAFTVGSAVLARLLVTAPLAFVAAGALLGFTLGPFEGALPEWLNALAEVTLVLILFHDAAQVRPRQIEKDGSLVARLLLIGFPLTVLLGYFTARALFPDLPVELALLLAAALAPTDAALGAPTVLNPAVPVRVRRMLNVESGLNDGLATPIVLFAIAATAGVEGLGPAESAARAVLELVIGVAAGALVGVLGGWAIGWSRRRGFSVPAGRALGVAMLPLLAYALALATSGNGFVSAFVAGSAFAGVARWTAQEETSLELTEAFATPLVYAVWLIFGLLAVPVIVSAVSPRELGFALLSLSILRMGPVALGLVGSGMGVRTVAFVGWFGPRGLASVVFALIALESLEDTGPLRTVVTTITVTVLLSVLAHGASALPLARRYGSWADTASPVEETRSSTEPQSRRMHHH